MFDPGNHPPPHPLAHCECGRRVCLPNFIQILSFQKIIHKQIKISGAVRAIKGQDVLPDGSTLDENGIIDGSTINIVIEPEKEINLRIKLGPKEFAHKVMNSVRLRELKEQLIDGDIVGFSINEFQLSILIIPADDKNGIVANVLLLDESLPLHLYGVGNNSVLRIIADNIRIHLVTQRGHHWFKQFPRSMTIEQMKKAIRSVDHFFTTDPFYATYNDTTLLTDILLFREDGESYRKMDDDEMPIGVKLSDNDVVHFIEERFFNKREMITVFYNNKEIGSIGWSMQNASDSCENETVLSLKLRLQDQLGLPVSCVDVKCDRESMENDDYIEDTDEIRIEVS